MKKVAVVLFNLGGPDSLKAVEPFLFNLFNDPLIIRLLNPLRFLLAKLISKRRNQKAQDIYKKMGGKSPILENTRKQADLLAKELGENFKVFIAMRYWHPLVEETIKQVDDYDPDEILLLPLYPQFSTTTTLSSIKSWQKNYKGRANVKTIGCYPQLDGFIDFQVRHIEKNLKSLDTKNTRILFSAHGLPEKVILDGDPYQSHVEASVAKIMEKLTSKIDYQVCYQSRVGPLKWIGPSTESEIERAGADKKDILLIPIAFVSEHSETLVELDMDYALLAKEHGVKNYIRVPTVSDDVSFIKSLKDLILKMIKSNDKKSKEFSCDKKFIRCICNG